MHFLTRKSLQNSLDWDTPICSQEPEPFLRSRLNHQIAPNFSSWLRQVQNDQNAALDVSQSTSFTNRSFSAHSIQLLKSRKGSYPHFSPRPHFPHGFLFNEDFLSTIHLQPALFCLHCPFFLLPRWWSQPLHSPLCSSTQ
jgi:hypothetical protein